MYGLGIYQFYREKELNVTFKNSCLTVIRQLALAIQPSPQHPTIYQYIPSTLRQFHLHIILLFRSSPIQQNKMSLSNRHKPLALFGMKLGYVIKKGFSSIGYKSSPSSLSFFTERIQPRTTSSHSEYIKADITSSLSTASLRISRVHTK